MGAFGPDASASLVSAVAPAASAVMGEDKTGDRLKQLLDGLVQKGVITQSEGEKLAAANEAVSKVIEVDDFAPEALSPIYRKAADVHQFFQGLGDQRAAS